MAATRFGTLSDGTDIEEVTIAAGDLTVKVITFGAVIRDVRLAGIDHPLVLGFDGIERLCQPLAAFRRRRRPLCQSHRRRPLRHRRAALASSRSNEKGRTHLHGGFKRLRQARLAARRARLRRA